MPAGRDTTAADPGLGMDVYADETFTPPTEDAAVPFCTAQAPTEEQAAVDAAAVNRPVEEWVNRYNAAVDHLQCTRFKQQLTDGKIRAGSSICIDILSDGAGKLRTKAESEGKGGSTPPHLTPEQISSVRAEGASVIFCLKGITLSGDAVKQGSGGYANIIDGDRSLAIIEGAKSYFHLENAEVKLKSVTHTLSDGQLTAVFDSGLTKLQSVRFTAKQHIRAEMSYLLTVEAELAYRLASEYQ